MCVGHDLPGNPSFLSHYCSMSAEFLGFCTIGQRKSVTVSHDQLNLVLVIKAWA